MVKTISKWVAVVAVAGVLVLPAVVRADNQFIAKNIGTSDPAPSVFNGTVYFYCTEDAVGGGNLAIYNIHCYSTTDMFHWKDCGNTTATVALYENNISWCSKGGNLWAPHVVYLGGKYHMYFPETVAGGTFYEGHASSTTPTGPFTADAAHMTTQAGNVIDPFCLVDSVNSKNYLVYDVVGTTPNTVYIQSLTATYDNCTGTATTLSLGTTSTYKEGMWANNYNSTWYMFFADWSAGAEVIKYSTATAATGPYTNKAQLMGTNNNSATIHPGVCQFGGQWYLFYHCDGAEWGGEITTGDKRVSGIEKFWFDGTGNVTPATIGKSRRGVGIPKVGDTIQIDRCNTVTGCAVSVVGGGEPVGWMVSGIGNGSSVVYDSVDFTISSGTISALARVACTNAADTIQIRLGSPTGTMYGFIHPASTGSLTTWATTPVTALTTTPPTGLQTLVLVFRGTATTMNVNWIQFSNVTAVNSSPAPAKAASLPYQRVNKNTFVVNGPANAAVRVFNLRGQDVVHAFTSTGTDNSLTVNLNAKELSSGSYVLSVKSGKGSVEVPFVY